MSENSKIPTRRVIRDKNFAKRIELACEKHSLAPSGHGRGKWLRDQLLEQFAVTVSPEAVRKWFSGEARPKPKMMNQLARILNVDEAWLSLGITPTSTPKEQRKQNADASGAVNLVAAQIQLAGGNIAFPDEEGPDLFAIIHGKHHTVDVRLTGSDEKVTLIVPTRSFTSTVIAVAPTDWPTVYRFFRVPSEYIDKYGNSRGGFAELAIERRQNSFFVGDETLPEIQNFSDLDGTNAPFKVRVRGAVQTL